MLKRDGREGDKRAHNVDAGKGAPLAILCRASAVQGFIPEPWGIWGQFTGTFHLFPMFLR